MENYLPQPSYSPSFSHNHLSISQELLPLFLKGCFPHEQLRSWSFLIRLPALCVSCLFSSLTMNPSVTGSTQMSSLRENRFMHPRHPQCHVVICQDVAFFFFQMSSSSMTSSLQLHSYNLSYFSPSITYFKFHNNYPFSSKHDHPAHLPLFYLSILHALCFLLTEFPHSDCI